MYMRKHPAYSQAILDMGKAVNLNKESVMVEVGCYRGESTKLWSSFNCTVYAVDHWKRYLLASVSITDMIRATLLTIKAAESNKELFRVFKRVEKDFDETCGPIKNIVKLKGYSSTMSRMFSNNFLDFVYIDARHDYHSVYNDINCWLPKVKKGGWIGGHDYCKEWPGVMRAVNQCFGKPDRLFTDTSWLKQV